MVKLQYIRGSINLLPGCISASDTDTDKKTCDDHFWIIRRHQPSKSDRDGIRALIKPSSTNVNVPNHGRGNTKVKNSILQSPVNSCFFICLKHKRVNNALRLKSKIAKFPI
uniref:Uncharacterized protein n=1 Tax=Schistocephalus solidus TaxID=70667 RepID=A0A0X3Q4K8_SCHSO